MMKQITVDLEDIKELIVLFEFVDGVIKVAWAGKFVDGILINAWPMLSPGAQAAIKDECYESLDGSTPI